MKIIKTAAVGSLVALAGAGTLAYFGPRVPQGVLQILLSPRRVPLPVFRDHLHQWDCSAAWSAVGAVAFAAGLIIAVAALAHANRSRGVSVFCRPLLFLAAAAGIAAATAMFHARGYFFLTFRALIAPDTSAAQFDDEQFRPPPPQFDAERFRQSLTLGPLYAGFALLVGVSVCLVAASFLKMTERPPRPPNRLLTISNMGLTVFLGLVFAAAFVVSCQGAHRLWWCFTTQAQVRASTVASIMYYIAAAQLVASVCLVGLSIALAGFACLLRTDKHANVLHDDALSL